MVNPIIAGGRWVKRARLRLLRAVAHDKKRWNYDLGAREFLQGRIKLSAYPRLLQIGSTMACNLRCFFCLRTVEAVHALHAQLKTRVDREMPPAVLEKTLRLMPYAQHFDLTPFGENFLFSQFEYLLDTHRRLGCNNLTMTTAGTLITPRWAERIVRSGVQQVKLSLEESDPERYAALRVGAKLDQVVEGIRLLTEWKRRLGSSVPRLTLAASYMQRNIERLPDMVRFAAAQGVPEIYVQLLELTSHDDPEVRKEELVYHVPLLRRMIAEGEAEACRLGISYVLTPPILNVLRAAEGKESSAGPEVRAKSSAAHLPLSRKCTNPWWWAYINENGELCPCCWAKVSFGNLQEKSFREVWNSAIAQDMRRRFLADEIPDYCRGQLCHVEYE